MRPRLQVRAISARKFSNSPSVKWCDTATHRTNSTCLSRTGMRLASPNMAKAAGCFLRKPSDLEVLQFAISQVVRYGNAQDEFHVFVPNRHAARVPQHGQSRRMFLAEAFELHGIVVEPDIAPRQRQQVDIVPGSRTYVENQA